MPQVTPAQRTVGARRSSLVRCISPVTIRCPSLATAHKQHESHRQPPHERPMICCEAEASQRAACVHGRPGPRAAGERSAEHTFARARADGRSHIQVADDDLSVAPELRPGLRASAIGTHRSVPIAVRLPAVIASDTRCAQCEFVLRCGVALNLNCDACLVTLATQGKPADVHRPYEGKPPLHATWCRGIPAYARPRLKKRHLRPQAGTNAAAQQHRAPACASKPYMRRSGSA